MQAITIRPHLMRQFGSTADAVFCLVTNPSLANHVAIDRSGGYRDYQTVLYAQGDDFSQLLTERIPEQAHVLVISPDAFIWSPDPAFVGPRRKLIVMACNSTPITLPDIAHFVRMVERTDPADQVRRSAQFFERSEQSDTFAFVNDQYGTRATLDHLNESYLWNEQTGFVDWGEQQIAPSGEISLLPINILEFDESLRLDVTGQIVLHGQPVLHSGSGISSTRQDQARLFAVLDAIGEHALIADIDHGKITSLIATHHSVEPARRLLESMFEIDSRYRILWEIGFSINTQLEMLPGNYAMNEVYGGTNGTVHWGLGLPPNTQYHLDIVSPGTAVIGRDDMLLLGERGRWAGRAKSKVLAHA